jgi:hypothetical protein
LRKGTHPQSQRRWVYLSLLRILLVDLGVRLDTREWMVVAGKSSYSVVIVFWVAILVDAIRFFYPGKAELMPLAFGFDLLFG